jgi:glycosyltransferase involved in cell wall biosynthesis
MNICLIAPVPPFRGGIAKYCYSLATELEKRHNLLLLSYKRQYPGLLYGNKKQIDLDLSREDILKEFKNISYDIDSVKISSWIKTAKTVSKFNPDIVLLPWWVTYWTPMYCYLLHSLRRSGIRVVFICINIFEHEDTILKNILTNIILKSGDSFIVHSELEKSKLLEINPKARIRKHFLPLFEYTVQTEQRHDTAVHLLFFGFVRPYKGLDTLLQALSILKNRDISLKIVGEFWNDKERYIDLINQLNISDRIEIIDHYVPDNDMSRYFSWADLVVLPYSQSITSGVIATAYGFKKPVLATNVGGFCEVIQDGGTGKIVASNDPQTFADGILWFLANRHIDFPGNIAKFSALTMSWSSLVDMIEEFQQQSDD